MSMTNLAGLVTDGAFAEPPDGAQRSEPDVTGREDE
jgi:hypothetical protein